MSRAHLFLLADFLLQRVELGLPLLEIERGCADGLSTKAESASRAIAHP